MQPTSTSKASEILAEHSQPKAFHHDCSVILTGNLVSKPEIRYRTNPVVPVAELVVATHARWFDKKSQSYKDWTTFHKAYVEGDMVEEELRFCQKGQLVYLKGILDTSKDGHQDFVRSQYLQVLGKGGHQSINQLTCTAQVDEPVRLMTTEQGSAFCHFNVTINLGAKTLSRPVNVWGKQAQYLAQHAKVGQQLIVEGSLNYQKDKKQLQLLDGKQIILGIALESTPSPATE